MGQNATSRQPCGTGPGKEASDRWWVVVGSGMAVFMASVDMSIVNVALPAIQGSFGTRTTIAEWVVLSYLLPLIALALPSGRWLDQVGQRDALAWSAAGFAISSIVAGLAPAIGWLIAARFVQGVFGAVLLALIPVMITTAVGTQVRGRAMGLVDTLGMLGLISGPALGGLLVDSVGWPWIFYLNAPVGGALIILALVQLPRGKPLRLPDPGWAAETVLLTCAVGALMIALTLTANHQPGWLAVGLVAVPLLLVWRRMPASLPLRTLVRLRGVLGPYAALASTATATGLLFYVAPFYLITVVRTSAVVAGLTVLAFPLAAVALGQPAGLLADRYGARRVAVLGATVMTCGLLLLVPLSRSWDAADIAWRLALAGAGVGLFNAPNMSAAMSATPAGVLATSGAATSLARQGGFALGPSLATVIWGLSDYHVGGIRAAVAIGAAILVLGAAPLAYSARRIGVHPLRPPQTRAAAASARRRLSRLKTPPVA